MTTARDLASGKCKPCGSGTPPLADERAAALLAALPGWQREGDAIRRAYAFKDHYETLAFVNAVAWISHREDHHPELAVGYDRCVVSYSTHSVGGLSENDFICAAKVDALFAS